MDFFFYLTRLCAMAFFITCSTFAACPAMQADEVFIDKLLAKKDYYLSPSGRHLLIQGQNRRYTVHEIKDTGVGPAHYIPQPQAIDFRWSRRMDADELYGVRDDELYKIDVQVPHLRGTQYPSTKVSFRGQLSAIRILQLPMNTNGPFVVSGRPNDLRSRALFRCRINTDSTPSCRSVADYSTGHARYFFSDDGRIVARLRRYSSVHRSAEFQIPDDSHSGWRSRYSYDPLETRFEPLNAPDIAGNLYAFSNRDREHVALIRFNIRDGQERVVVKASFDLTETFQNPYTGEVLAVAGSPNIQRIIYRNPVLSGRTHHLLDELGRPARVEFLSSDFRNRRFVVRIRNAQIGHAVILLRADGHFEYLNREPRRIKSPEQTRYIAPTPIQIRAREGPAIEALLTKPRGITGPMPFVIMIHGGPKTQYRWTMHPLVQRMAVLGMAVLQLNYRGSYGYGKTYADFILRARDPVEAASQDVRTAYQWLRSENIGKQHYGGLWGESFGATVALRVAGKAAGQYRALVLLNGLIDFPMFIRDWKQRRDAGFRTWARYFGTDNLTDLLHRSRRINPCALAANVKAQTLMFAGLRDRVTHPDQSLALYDELRARGTLSKLKLLRHGHDLLVPQRVVRIFADTAEFFHQRLVLRESRSGQVTFGHRGTPANRPADQCLAPRRTLRP